MISSLPYFSCSSARDSRVVKCVVHVVNEALSGTIPVSFYPLSNLHPPCVHPKTHLSNDPGVIVGVSPTLKLADFLVFFSKYFFARALSLALYSFSMMLRSR